MSDETQTPQQSAAPQDAESTQPTLPPAAQRALAEAAQRRKEAEAKAKPPVELGGRDGLDPARYGDWEKKGIAIDF
ncbi:MULTISPECIES: DUF1674 domain-containing protein [Pseudophaeobacter]|jgi:hypothetical protein|uniref:DUF1674 domain-containing protein n=1 Tax=Pseudophaeobacter TaxID=1541822 RepID=UPI00242FE667|nr:DUF1674 domain-containing protein [Pseudophaeobacter profundi]